MADKLKDIVTEITNELSKIEVHSHTEVLLKKEYDKRYNALTNMINTINNEINKNPHYQGVLLPLKYRINHSIRIMDLVKDCDLVKEL